MHQLEFKNFKFKYLLQEDKTAHKTVDKAWFECPNCLQKITENQKNNMLDHGQWIAKFPKIRKRRGYHINAFYIKFGLGKTWQQIAQIWIDTQGDDFKLQAFINTYLGEVWQERGETIQATSLLTRLESYQLLFGGKWQIAPNSVRVAGVDVQKDRFEATIIDYEASEEAWVIQHLIIPADTAIITEYHKLKQQLTDWGVEAVAIDSGYNTSLVYEFCDKNRWAIPIKGVTGMARPLIEDKIKRTQRLRRRRKKGYSPEPIGVDQGKGLIYARLRFNNPTNYQHNQQTGEIEKIDRQPMPGYIHFDNEPCFDDEYFQQLASEKLITKKRAGREIKEWKQQRPRNEALDCMLYALVAFRLMSSLKKAKGKQPATIQPSHKRKRRGR